MSKFTNLKEFTDKEFEDVLFLFCIRDRFVTILYKLRIHLLKIKIN